MRKKILNKRNNIPVNIRFENSNMILKNIKSLKQYQKYNTIGIYYSINSEVSTHDLLKNALSEKKIVGIPKIVNETRIEFYRIIESEYDQISWIKGKHGTMENDSSEIISDDIQLIIIPGIVFDKHGNRIGYGKGYFDRFLSTRRPKCVVGLAFEDQVINQIIPKEQFDRPVDIVVTEKHIIEINKNI
ncbi:MAG: 5-formyltetrahydrofolate cyclo-ligase [Nitrososphaeraceae archaeon]